MDEKWKIFENDCVDYLNHTFGKFAMFSHYGGSDSTQADILVKTKSGKQFFIESKMNKAQCGQFVLFPNLNEKKFDYSNKNKSNNNIYSNTIIDYMNKNFEIFNNVGTGGKEIYFENCENTFKNWIVNHYDNLNVKLFISKICNSYIVFPIRKILDYFFIQAKYRVKKSGSTKPGISKCNDILDYLKNNYDLYNSKIEDGKLFVTLLNDKIDLKFYFNDNEYYFSLINNSKGFEYEIRKLSKTHNANVIFSIKPKTNIVFNKNDLNTYFL